MTLLRENNQDMHLTSVHERKHVKITRSKLFWGPTVSHALLDISQEFTEETKRSCGVQHNDRKLHWMYKTFVYKEKALNPQL